MNPDHSFYLALCPDSDALGKIASCRDAVAKLLGGAFRPQLSPNLHMTMGHFSTSELSGTDFQQSLPEARISGTRKNLPEGSFVESDNGTPFSLRILARQKTGEVVLALCFPCREMEARRASMKQEKTTIPPHVTLGKFIGREGEPFKDFTARIKKSFAEKEGIFKDIDQVLMQLPQTPLRFDSYYLAASHLDRAAVPNHPQIPTKPATLSR